MSGNDKAARLGRISDSVMRRMMQFNMRQMFKYRHTAQYGYRLLHLTALKIYLAEPITQAGKVSITATAKSKEGCETFFPYYVIIAP
jgi:hypothetical protein